MERDSRSHGGPAEKGMASSTWLIKLRRDSGIIVNFMMTLKSRVEGPGMADDDGYTPV